MTRRLLDASIRDETLLNELSEPRRLRAIGRAGGALFCAGALLSGSSFLTLEPLPPAWAFAVVALAFLTGLVCFFVPWDSISPAWLHAIPVVGTLQITAGVWGAAGSGHVYAWLYLIVVVTVAFAFRSRNVVVAYVAFVSACLAVPLIDPATSASDSARNLLVGGPTLALAALVVTHFRERLEAGKQAYRVLSRLDPLTGVGNYRTLFERLDYEIARHQRYLRRFAVILLDLKGFKQVNESYGHLEGDRVLRAVGVALATTVRDQDTVARQGGDEFSVLAPETTPDEAASLVGRLQDALAAIPLAEGGLTASVGFAVYPQDGQTAEELLAHADGVLRGNKAERDARAWSRAVSHVRFSAVV
jgi:diguanylate cyclase (GGDEF)-like protein